LLFLILIVILTVKWLQYSNSLIYSKNFMKYWQKQTINNNSRRFLNNILSFLCTCGALQILNIIHVCMLPSVIFSASASRRYLLFYLHSYSPDTEKHDIVRSFYIACQQSSDVMRKTFFLLTLLAHFEFTGHNGRARTQSCLNRWN